jgi:type II secretory pathway predicted ATPase ExeA
MRPYSASARAKNECGSSSLSRVRTRQYLHHHLALVGRKHPLFADDANARLHKVSLALNNAAIAALIAAATAGKALVDDDCATKAVGEITRD